MELGIISDTHGLVRPEIYEIFAGVDLILHAGDIGGSDVIVELEVIAPVQAIAGNNDPDLFGKFPTEKTLNLDGRTFQLVHYPPDAPEDKTPEEPVSHVIVFGHSHKPLNEISGSTLYFNPGSAGPRRFKLPITAGRMTLDGDTVRAEIISLEK